MQSLPFLKTIFKAIDTKNFATTQRIITSSTATNIVELQMELYKISISSDNGYAQHYGTFGDNVIWMNVDHGDYPADTKCLLAVYPDRIDVILGSHGSVGELTYVRDAAVAESVAEKIRDIP
jgi:hypothetical protein